MNATQDDIVSALFGRNGKVDLDTALRMIRDNKITMWLDFDSDDEKGTNCYSGAEGLEIARQDSLRWLEEKLNRRGWVEWKLQFITPYDSRANTMSEGDIEIFLEIGVLYADDALEQSAGPMWEKLLGLSMNLPLEAIWKVGSMVRPSNLPYNCIGSMS